MLLGCSELEIREDRWQSRSGWYPLRGRPIEFNSINIESIQSQKKMSSGSGVDEKQWMNLVANLTDGNEVTLIRYVLGGTSERQLLAELRHRARLAEDGSPSAKAEDTGLWDYVN